MNTGKALQAFIENVSNKLEGNSQKNNFEERKSEASDYSSLEILFFATFVNFHLPQHLLYL